MIRFSGRQVCQSLLGVRDRLSPFTRFIGQCGLPGGFRRDPALLNEVAELVRPIQRLFVGRIPTGSMNVRARPAAREVALAASEKK